MVSSRNISAFPGIPPRDDETRTIRTSEPLYGLEQILPILEQAEAIKAITRKCSADVQMLGLDEEALKTLVASAVTAGRYRGSEWCVTGSHGAWAACDAYEHSRLEWNQAAYRELEFSYYIKLAVAKTGRLVLLISCHVSQPR